MVRWKKILTSITALIVMISSVLSGCTNLNNANINSDGNYTTVKDEEYYMITFQSGMEYWKNCYKGFGDAGNSKGVKTVYTGGIQYDINQEVTAMEQVIAKKPAGIAVSCMNAEALYAPIQKAISAGIPVVTFDADSPGSGRTSFLGTGNEYAGSVAARALDDMLRGIGGEVVVITLPAQENHEERVAGFKKTIEEECKNLKLVQIGNCRSDQTEAARLLSTFLQYHPNIRGVFCTDATSGVGAAAAVKEANKVGQIKIMSFDTDRGTLDSIKSGIISATIAQGTYDMGYRSMELLYELHNGTDKKLPTFVDTGVNVVTRENVKSFYTK